MKEEDDKKEDEIMEADNEQLARINIQRLIKVLRSSPIFSSFSSISINEDDKEQAIKIIKEFTRELAGRKIAESLLKQNKMKK